MTSGFNLGPATFRRTLLAALATAVFAAPALAQGTIKIGELNSYKAAPFFLEPYKKGIEMALEEVNKDGVLGKKMEFVFRDDGANPGEAVRVAEELVSREGVNILAGTFLSNVGLAFTEYCGKKQVFCLAAEPLTDKIIWENGNKYTFRLRQSTYMQVNMMMKDIIAAKKKRWALVYPNFEFGQAAVAAFKKLMAENKQDIEIVADQATPLFKIDAGAVAQAIDDAKPDAIFNAQFGADLTKFVREGNTRGIFKDRFVAGILSGEPEYLEPMKDEAPVGWLVTGYPWYGIDKPEHKAWVAAYQAKFKETPRLGSLVGYLTVKSLAAGIKKAGSTDTEKMVQAFKGLEVDSPLGPFSYRAIDHQSTLGIFVGTTALKDGGGVMTNFRYIDGGTMLPSDAEVKKMRTAAD